MGTAALKVLSNYCFTKLNRWCTWQLEIKVKIFISIFLLLTINNSDCNFSSPKTVFILRLKKLIKVASNLCLFCTRSQFYHIIFLVPRELPRKSKKCRRVFPLYLFFFFPEEGKLFSLELILQIWPQVSINFSECYSSGSLCVLDKPTLPEPTSALWSVSVSVPRWVRAQNRRSLDCVGPVTKHSRVMELLNFLRLLVNSSQNQKWLYHFSFL